MDRGPPTALDASAADFLIHHRPALTHFLALHIQDQVAIGVQASSPLRNTPAEFGLAPRPAAARSHIQGAAGCRSKPSRCRDKLARTSPARNSERSDATSLGRRRCSNCSHSEADSRGARQTCKQPQETSSVPVPGFNSRPTPPPSPPLVPPPPCPHPRPPCST